MLTYCESCVETDVWFAWVIRARATAHVSDGVRACVCVCVRVRVCVHNIKQRDFIPLLVILFQSFIFLRDQKGAPLTNQKVHLVDALLQTFPIEP